MAVVVFAAGSLFPMPPSSGAPMCFGREATKVGTSGSDTLRGTGGDDVIIGLAGRDLIKGRGGNDRICGGGHNDYLGGDNFGCRGTPGRDMISGDDGSDNLYGDGCRGGRGPGRADVLLGGARPDVLNGGPGDDRVDGEGSDRDFFLIQAAASARVDLARNRTGGAEGSDRLASIERVFSRECRRYGDVIVGNGKANVIYGSEGPDEIRARSGGDVVRSDGIQNVVVEPSPTAACEGGAADRVFGGSGTDRLHSAAANDYVDGGPGSDRADAGGGTDICVAVERRRRCEL